MGEANNIDRKRLQVRDRFKSSKDLSLLDNLLHNSSFQITITNKKFETPIF